ncbi:MAG: hypothetical protein WCG29_07330 [Desulfomonile sp.]|jgi:hypothetical protein|nr:hypothetical protein [Deltaproteobacteria bacterium]
MRLVIHLTILIFLAGCFLSLATSHAQSTAAVNRPEADQAKWNSHQMNQPPPRDERYHLSAERLEEIRQLYLESKKQLEGKAGAKSPESE